MEKYGEIPKRFTKAWWEYFWEYYKWHTIVGFFAVCAAVITVIQIASKADYDLTVSYMGEIVYDDEASFVIADKMEEIVPDTNKNNNADVNFVVMPLMPGIETNAQYTMAMESKKILELQFGETCLFIIDAKQAAAFFDTGIADGIFLPADEWLKSGASELERADGLAADYFVKLENTVFFNDAGVYPAESYVGIRKIREEETEQEYKERREAAEILADFLVKK